MAAKVPSIPTIASVFPEPIATSVSAQGNAKKAVRIRFPHPVGSKVYMNGSNNFIVCSNSMARSKSANRFMSARASSSES